MQPWRLDWYNRFERYHCDLSFHREDLRGKCTGFGACHECKDIETKQTRLDPDNLMGQCISSATFQWSQKRITTSQSIRLWVIKFITKKHQSSVLLVPIKGNPLLIILTKGQSVNEESVSMSWRLASIHDTTAWGHDDVIKWKHISASLAFVWGIHRSSVNSPHKGQWRRALMFSLICVWINGWVNNREAGDLIRYRAHYDVSAMELLFTKW